MDNRIIDIISNIKVIGWVTILTFSGVLYYCFSSLISAFLVNRISSSMMSPIDMNNPNIMEMNSLITQLTFWFIFTGLIAIAGIFIGQGLIHIRKWAVLAFHILSMAIGLLIVSGTVYLVLQSYQTSTDEFLEMRSALMKYQAMTIGSFGLLITWLITKANMLLFRREYRLEMN